MNTPTDPTPTQRLYTEEEMQAVKAERDQIRRTLDTLLLDSAKARMRVSRQNTAMREALAPFVSEFKRKLAHSGRNSTSRKDWNNRMPDGFPVTLRVTIGDCRRAAEVTELNAALSDTTGRDFIPREKVLQLAEALRKIADLCQRTGVTFEDQSFMATELAIQALSHTKELGL